MAPHLRSNPRPSCWTLTRLIRVWALIILAVVSLASQSTAAQSDADGSGAVYVVPITGTIDLGLTP
jgi:hypothetical protein